MQGSPKTPTAQLATPSTTKTMRIMLKKLLALSLAAGLAVPAAAQTIRSYITCPDRSELFAQQKHAAEFSTQRQENRNYIIIDPRQSYQRIDGFGYALTGGSAEPPDEDVARGPQVVAEGALRPTARHRHKLHPADARRLRPQQLRLFLRRHARRQGRFRTQTILTGTRPPRRGSGHAGDPGPSTPTSRYFPRPGRRRHG